ncbi:MAG: APC family permease [Clostridiales bacterium]
MATNTPIIAEPKELKRRDIFLGMICVMFFLDTVGPVASMGASAITWSLIITLIFFFPSGLIMAEMGSAYPAEGGMYAWVKMAYGSRWGARISWLYWANNAIWISSTSIFTVSVFCQIFLGEVDFFYQLIMSIVLIWGVILFGLGPLKSATKLTNFAAIFKVTITGAMGLMAILFLLKGNSPANDLSLKAFTPKLDQSFLFFSALIYNYLGFEVMSSMGNKIKNPAKDVPRATIANAFVISALYIVAVLSIIIIVPLDNMTIVDAIMDCFLFAGLSPGIGKVVVLVVGTLFLAILFAQAATWIVAAGRLAAGAAQDNELPMLFGKMHKTTDTPMGALLITGTIGTILAIIYGFVATTAEDLFWTLFSFTNIIFLMPYIINFQAFLKLRKTKTPLAGSYHVPGPNFIGTIFARIEQIILCLTIFIIIFTPGKPLELYSCLALLGGTGAVLIIGEILIRISQKKNTKV